MKKINFLYCYILKLYIVNILIYFLSIFLCSYAKVHHTCCVMLSRLVMSTFLGPHGL